MATTYSTSYTAPVSCITSDCDSASAGKETFSFVVPLQSTEITGLPLTLPKFNTMSGTRILRKVLLSVKSTLRANALLENSSPNASEIVFFKENSSFTIDQGANTIVSLPLLSSSYVNIPVAPAVLLNGLHGSYPGDLTNSTLQGMGALNPSPIADFNNFLDPRANPNWVTTLTGNASDDDDIIYLPPASVFSTNNTVFTSALGDFTGTGDLSYTLSTLTGYSISGGGGNLNIYINTRAGATLEITYLYCTPAALPIKLLSLNATKNNDNSVKVNWVVGEQINVNHYEIEQSMNGINFNTVGKITAGNNLNYSFNYLNAESGLNYFRLKTIDNDGTISYSYIVKVLIPELTGNVSVYPNPTTSLVNISLGSNGLSKAATIKIIGVDGRILVQQKINAFSSKVSINVNNLPAGKYFIRIESESQVINKALVILR